MAEKSKRKPKFSMGQVVRCGDYVRGDVKLNFGKIISRSSDHVADIFKGKDKP